MQSLLERPNCKASQIIEYQRLHPSTMLCAPGLFTFGMSFQHGSPDTDLRPLLLQSAEGVMRRYLYFTGTPVDLGHTIEGKRVPVSGWL